MTQDDRDKEPAFEDALERLEGLVEDMESGDLPLEETIQKFEEGQQLLQVCGRLLERAELRVKTILRNADATAEGPGAEDDGADDAGEDVDFGDR